MRELAALMRRRADIYVLAPNRGGLLRITRLASETPQAFYFRCPQELDGLVNFLRAAGIERIHYHHTVRLGDELLRLPGIFKTPYDYTVHDYFRFCPQITATTEAFAYCGEPDDSGCNEYLRIRPASTNEPIERWRSRHQPFVEGADRVFAPSTSVEGRVRRYFPNASIISAPHPELIGASALPHPAGTV